MPTSPSVTYDAYAHYGHYVLASLEGKGNMPAVRSYKCVKATEKHPVGILGAGAAGLYTAMLLEDLGIPYKIIEARGDVGGRLFTYFFQRDNGAPYNYFDVGAMRFPKTESMNRVFNLFENENLNTPDIALNARLRPFYFQGAGNNNTFLDYNGVSILQNAIRAKDQFKDEAVILDADATSYINAGVKAIVDDVISPYASAILDDLKSGGGKGWDKMLSVDNYSTRAYMSLKYEPSSSLNIPSGPLPTDVVNWCETFDKSTGWYNRGFTETVLEAIAFGWNPDPNAPSTRWFCIDGGSNKIAQAMAAYIRKQKGDDVFDFNTRVNYIGMGRDDDTDIVEVKAEDSDQTYKFSHVISTIPLPVLRTINTKNAGMSVLQLNALRELEYGPSVKIGMQFRSAWWTNGKDKNGRTLNIIGGQTYTDRILRTVVYPSFGDVSSGKTTTLIASYCWTEDATRLAALIDNDDKVSPALTKLVLTELAEIHNVDFDYLKKELVDVKAWSWSQDPNTMGAFAFFGPGDFQNLYSSLNAPAANGALHFAGEALSVRHAWVEGALDSAWRAVSEMLIYMRAEDDVKMKFTRNWGANYEWVRIDPKERRGGVFKAPGAPKPEDIASRIFDPAQSLLFQHLVKHAELSK